MENKKMNMKRMVKQGIVVAAILSSCGLGLGAANNSYKQIEKMTAPVVISRTEYYGAYEKKVFDFYQRDGPSHMNLVYSTSNLVVKHDLSDNSHYSNLEKNLLGKTRVILHLGKTQAFPEYERGMGGSFY